MTLTSRQPAERAVARVSWRVLLLTGRAEAFRLCRSPLVVAGLLIAAALTWWNSRTMVPHWPVWDVQIGSALLAVAGSVLVAAHLSAGRVRRDGAEELYDSYPAPASARTAAHLLGLAGPLVLAAVLTAAAVFWLDRLGPVGSPRLTVLAQGLLLVTLAGTIGVALGSYLPHPMAGILTLAVIGAIEADLLLPFGAPVQMPGGSEWLLPWAQPWILGDLPGATPVFPPEAHLAWLAALTALAAAVALWRVAWRRRPTRFTVATALVAAASLAMVGWSGWAQIRPLPAAAPKGLANQVTQAVQAEECVSRQEVRYCFYPQFRPDVARWATAVNGVLGRLPSPPPAPLVIRQVVDTNVLTYPLFSGSQPVAGHLANEVDQYVNEQAHDPHLIPGSSVPPVYVDLNWGAGSAVGPYQLGLAMQTAWWVARLPTTWQPVSSAVSLAQTQTSCLPVGQAREAIALWLAASATPATRAAFPAALRYGPAATKVAGELISSYVGLPVSGYSPALQFTAQGAALAQAMLQLPGRQVGAVLSARWPGWLSPRATDSQLAAALRIPLPSAPLPAPLRLPATSRRPAGSIFGFPALRADPVCT